jgi:DNA-binding CsgD family transcriptional regulator
MTHAQSLLEEKEDGQTRLAQHLLELDGGQWALWRCAALRGTGFPASLVLRLSIHSAAAAADSLLASQQQAELARSAALAAVNNSLDILKQQQQWDSQKARRTLLLDLLRALKAGKPLSPQKLSRLADSDTESFSAVEQWQAALGRVEQARHSYEQQYRAGVAEASERLREIAGEGRFSEAVTWQNRQAVQTCLKQLRRETGEEERGSRRRQHEELAANYVQRYSVKNDTIGFFGPVGWAKLEEGEESLRVEAGEGLLRKRRVYFEGWGIDAVVGVMNGRRELRPWMSPRRLPVVRVEGATLYHPLAGAHKITAEQAAVLRLCDGSRTARELARRLITSPFSVLRTEAQVYAILESLRNQGVIVWEFEVPVELHPERTIRRQLDRIDDERLRREALSHLEEMEAARATVAAAAGDAEKLNSAIENLEEVFTRLTGEDSTRSLGKLYAGRTLVYEDCTRNVEVVVGRQVLDQLAAPLQLLLTSSRWLTSELATTYRKAFKHLYDRIVRQTGSRVVEAIQFWMQAEPLVNNDSARLAAQIGGEFQARWSKILPIPAGERQVNFRSEELRPRVLEAFDAPGPGWSFARHHSPDVMMAAESVEAARRGDFQLVMGELHVGRNTIGASLFVSQHPSVEELFRYVELDLPEVKAVPMTPKAWVTSRTNVALISPQDYRIEFERESLVADRSKALAIADLVVEERDGQIIVRTRDGRLCFDIIEIFGGTFSGIIMDYMKILTPAPHTPRVTIDKLIVARETWRFSPDALDWPFLKQEHERYAEARRWARTHELPSRCFVKVPVEAKPFYLDFDSPIYVGVLAKMVRRTVEEGGGGSIVLSEMKPEVGEAWLPDVAGQRYTSEFRIVAFDLARS